MADKRRAFSSADAGAGAAAGFSLSDEGIVPVTRRRTGARPTDSGLTWDIFSAQERKLAQSPGNDR